MKPLLLLSVIMQAMICAMRFPKPELTSFSISNSPESQF